FLYLGTQGMTPLHLLDLLGQTPLLAGYLLGLQFGQSLPEYLGVLHLREVLLDSLLAFDGLFQISGVGLQQMGTPTDTLLGIGDIPIQVPKTALGPGNGLIGPGYLIFDIPDLL